MRPIPTLLAALIALMALAGCGTKTPLVLPSPEQKSANAAVSPTMSREKEALYSTLLADRNGPALESYL